MGKIASEDISFVVQGAIDKENTPICIKYIRKNFPKSKIILSTWQDSNTEGLDYDELILNNDPGGWKNPQGFYDNTNRQIVSSINGLKQVKTQYAVKIRSDMAILSNKFIKYFNKFQKRSEEYKFYQNRAIVYVNTCKFQHLDEITPFHISDLFIFGNTADLIKMFDISLLNSDDIAFKYSIFPTNTPRNFYKHPQRYYPEQYVHAKAFIDEFNIPFHHRFCCNSKMVEISNKYIANNYIILSNFQMPFLFLKKNRNEYLGVDYQYWKWAINHFEWLKLYIKYCDNNLSFPKIQYGLYKIMIRLIYKNKLINNLIKQSYRRLY